MKKLTPFNIDLMFATERDVRGLRPTTKTDIYEGVTSNFHDDGLFSTLTFGRVGTPERDTRFSYIPLNASVIHPAMIEVIKKLKRSYLDIINGKAYAKWDPVEKDFAPSTVFEGETGMAFFVSHLKELSPAKNASKKRNMYVDVFEKYKALCLMNNCIVIPAGIRDLYVDQDGRDVQDEINDYYRSLIAISDTINLIGGKQNSSMVDIPRRNLQKSMNDIYNYIKGLLEGKKGLIQSKWGSRKIALGTRNVLSGIESLADELGSPRAPTVDHVQVGLLQSMIALLPIVIYQLQSKFLADVFPSIQSPTYLIHPKTLKLTQVKLEPHLWDKWGTSEGIEKKLKDFEDDVNRSKPIMIKGHYLYLVYHNGKTFKVFRDISELPDASMVKHVHPMTYGELYYLCFYEGWYEQVGLVTRYPIAGIYSIYPAKVYTKTTLDAIGCWELGDDWVTKIGYAREYPTGYLNEQTPWFNTASVSSTKLGVLSADFDGTGIALSI